MTRATFRFYEELNSYLPENQRKKDFQFEVEGSRTVGELVEAIGVPPDEVDLVLADGRPVDFDHLVREGERISVYPVFESLNIEEVTRIPSRPLRTIKFVLDSDLKDLAAYLRTSGYEVQCRAFSSMGEIIAISEKEKRVILTTHARLLESEEVTRVILLPQSTPEVQLKRIMEAVDIEPAGKGRRG